MNEDLKNTLLQYDKEKLIKYIDLMLNVIMDLENKNKVLKEELENGKENKYMVSN